ncbi:hypothetical protein OBBRIDRAFT_775554 [Obba rivulosa]|uniref:AB hydrolase-1 domain-containing protein n=1 Tax=Obba rivulosa TaxID=1052685 RepID=A0A8E2AZR4_9APHY|nr:hypothetical protein OBBRIDRAFT_775554 [Obba rivulosa]
MSVGPADDKGTVLYYEDTGAPEGSQKYTTLILVHGAMFHGAIFQRMFPHAAARNLRIVAVNKRDYAGSTPFTPQEQDALRGPVEEQRAVLEAMGLQLAHFIAWFIRKENIPPVSESSGMRTGGFALVGWSAGNMDTISLLANADKLSQATRELFETYFRTFVVYEMAARTAGENVDLRTGVRAPWWDPNVPSEDKVKAFQIFVSMDFPPVAELTGDLPGILARKPLLEEGSSKPTTTAARMTPEELAAVIDAETFLRSHALVSRIDPSILRQNIRRAILDCRSDLGSGGKGVIWPALQVKSVWADMSLGESLMGHWMLSDYWNTEHHLGHDGLRPLKTFKFENGNHLAHWDDAERFTEFLSKIL